jgi:hypothetical protein
MKETKKVIRQAFHDVLMQATLQFDPSTPSKKIIKLIDGASKKISDQLKVDLKKNAKKESKLAKAPARGIKKA